MKACCSVARREADTKARAREPCAKLDAMKVDAWQPRETCKRCGRPTTFCYCAELPTLPTATRILLLQHPREREKAIGTAKMASLCLPNSTLHVGKDWSQSQAVARALNDPERPAVLLYPGVHAKDILQEPPQGPVTLVVVDGTWSQARTVVRDNPILAQLPRYAFSAPRPSEYRIRKEPSDEVVSTIEALMHVLGVLENRPEKFSALLQPFRAMVDKQITFREGGKGRTRKRRPRHAPEPVQRMRERWNDLVCVVGEFNAWPLRLGRRKHEEELVQWVVARPSTGDRLNLIAAPNFELSPTTCRNSGLSAEMLLSAEPRNKLVERFSEFLRPSDVLASWGTYALDLFRTTGGTLDIQTIDLRPLYTHYTHKKFGTLELVAQHRGVAWAEGPRAPQRIEVLLDVARSLYQKWPNE